MDQHQIYMLVESGPVLEICEDWRRRHAAAKRAAWNLAKDLGSGYYSACGTFVGFMPAYPPPDGWMNRKPRSRNGNVIMVPDKKNGEAAQALIDALPKEPKQSEIMQAIGHPGAVRYKSENGSGSFIMGMMLEPVQLFYPSEEGPLFIVAPDADYWITQVKPGAVILEGHWSPPAGLKVISEARKNLLCAQERCRIEEAVAPSGGSRETGEG